MRSEIVCTMLRTRSGPTPFSSIRASSITPAPSGPSRCVIYRLIKILGNKISPENLEGRRSSSPKGAPSSGYNAFMGDQIHICEGPAHARVGANIVNKSRILYTPSETTRWKRGRQKEKEGERTVGGQRCSALIFGHLPTARHAERGDVQLSYRKKRIIEARLMPRGSARRMPAKKYKDVKNGTCN